jgi:hypothetical protein
MKECQILRFKFAKEHFKFRDLKKKKFKKSSFYHKLEKANNGAPTGFG